MERFRGIKNLGKKAVHSKAGRIAFSALLMAVIADGDASADSVISASPNPIPAGTTGPGATEISWNTGNPAGEVMLSVNGAPEVLFNRGVSGLDRPNWFNAGNRYDFNVYSDSSRTSLLGSTKVLRSATSQPLSVTPEAGNPDLYTLSFNGNGISDTMQVWVAVNHGPESLVVQNPHYTWTGINWIQPGNTYTFTEYAGQGKLPEGIVNRIDVVKGSTATPTPTPTPVINELPRSVTWANQTWSINPNITVGESPNNPNRIVNTIDISGGSVSRIQPYESQFGLLSGNNRTLYINALIHSDSLNKVVAAIAIDRGGNFRSPDMLTFDGTNPTIQQVVGSGIDKNTTAGIAEMPFSSFTKTTINNKETLRLVLRTNSLTRTYNCDLTVLAVPCVLG